MRLTSVMMTNTTLMHINRNMRNLNNIIRSLETGQRIQRPSDDPIIASRALLFRTSVSENTQFQRNVEQGMAWMNVSEAAFDSINSRTLFEIRNLAVQGANGDNNLENMQMIIQNMKALYEMLGREMNNTFGGDYLFSGFRTDEPPVFKSPNERSFIITQHFGPTDIAREQSWQRLVVPTGLGIHEPVTHNINVLKLAFTGLDARPVIPGFAVIERSIHDDDAYLPPAYDATGVPVLPVLHFIAETGELVMHSETAVNFPREGISVTFRKTGFQEGDLNPKVYFTGREIITESTAHIPPDTELIYNITQYFSRHAGTAVAVGTPPTHYFEFELAFPVYADATHDSVGLRPSLPPGAVILPGTNTVRIPAQFFDTNSNVSVTYSTALYDPILADADGTHIMAYLGVAGVELVRAIGSDGIPIPLHQIELNPSFDMHNQEIQYEVAPRTHITVNSLAKNILTDKMFADFRRFFEFADSLQLTERHVLEQHFRSLGYEREALDDAIQRQQDRESSMATYALHRRFDDMLFLIDRHFDNSQREQTLLGARMVRMELVQNRLEQDEISYTRLVSDNEDTDLIHATILRFSAEAIFTASLMANSGVIQLSLANFLR